MLDLWLIAGGRCTSTLQLQIMMALLPIKLNGTTRYSHEIMNSSIKIRCPTRTFADPVLYIARHCIPSNRCWCMSHPNQLGCRSRLCKVRADSTSSWDRIIYKKCGIKTLYLVKHWMETFQGNISRIVWLNPHQSMNWIILSERSDNYLLHAFQKRLSSGIQTLLKETKYDPGNLMHIA